jgi:hypothetical protein
LFDWVVVERDLIDSIEERVAVQPILGLQELEDLFRRLREAFRSAS